MNFELADVKLEKSIDIGPHICLSHSWSFARLHRTLPLQLKIPPKPSPWRSIIQRCHIRIRLEVIRLRASRNLNTLRPLARKTIAELITNGLLQVAALPFRQFLHTNTSHRMAILQIREHILHKILTDNHNRGGHIEMIGPSMNMAEAVLSK